MIDNSEIDNSCEGQPLLKKPKIEVADAESNTTHNGKLTNKLTTFRIPFLHKISRYICLTSFNLFDSLTL